jgi:hypothetical protein
MIRVLDSAPVSISRSHSFIHTTGGYDTCTRGSEDGMSEVYVVRGEECTVNVSIESSTPSGHACMYTDRHDPRAVE